MGSGKGSTQYAFWKRPTHLDTFYPTDMQMAEINALVEKERWIQEAQSSFTSGTEVKGEFYRFGSHWNHRFYTIHSDGNLTYEKYLEKTSWWSGQRTGSLCLKNTISIENNRNQDAIEIKTRNNFEVIRKADAPKFFLDLSYVYTHLKDKESLRMLHDAMPSLVKSAAATELLGRRRMAQRESSSRRDSPVMARLLEEIVAAQ